MTLRGLRRDDAGWVLEQHARHYLDVEGFSPEFEAVVAQALADFLARADTTHERAWIAERDAQRVGCVFMTRHDARTAQLRLFYVTDALRGTGLGRQLLEHLVSSAASLGYSRLLVRTYDRHSAAGRLYARAGFALTATRPVRSFGQDMIEQSWEMPLGAG